MSLNVFGGIRRMIMAIRMLWFRRVWGMDIHPSVKLSLKAHLDQSHPRGIHIGERSQVAFGAAILSHDVTRQLKVDTRIGRHCFIGAESVVLPGITIGDDCIVGAGAVVVGDVPPGCIVAGNPARIVRKGIEVGPYGRLANPQGRDEGPEGP